MIFFLSLVCAINIIIIGVGNVLCIYPRLWQHHHLPFFLINLFVCFVFLNGDFLHILNVAGFWFVIFYTLTCILFKKLQLDLHFLKQHEV